ncbi:Bacteriocin-protection, YdeI or OmpD-Associated [Filimonas lacunae]|uniref:Bacteriocin-protection, YdeI or OmpD-Associated n=1 Tax=Filimonas lacunae TaxID=477680 RepID=A0A173MDX4_9BACT|nr:YdeI/OmpD-associated family protein [Filimonas lacunae]BAV05696.1 hypothetical protein FLA_1708 [Filimonas lacunae]SIT28870.1 Bacteriocin-protection, YdeI or OmpD-Associated [Filimonas lacunae]
MSQQSLFEKLQLKDEKNLLIQGIPSAIEKQFSKLSFSKNVTPLLKAKRIDFALVFVVNQNQMCSILKDVFPAMQEEGKLWIAYPKQASKIASDLNRDCSWQILAENEYESVRQVALDHVWTATRFKKLETIPNRTRAFSEIKNPDIDGIDFDKRLVVPPLELETLFMKHDEAKDFFTSLSFTNQKEYVSWIAGAKRADTKARRVEATLEKLLAGKKNPTDK